LPGKRIDRWPKWSSIMKSVKCRQCGFVAWANAETCNKCGAALTPDPNAPASSRQPASAFTYYSDQDSFANQDVFSRQDAFSDQDAFSRPLKKGLAIASLVLGIANFFTFGLFGPGFILGIVLALVALSRIKRAPNDYGGREYAVAGLITSIVSVACVIPVLVIAATIVPNVLAARSIANERSGIYTIRQIASVEERYQIGNGEYASLEDLVSAKLLPADLLKEHNGYKFVVTTSKSSSGTPSFRVNGNPVSYPISGRHSLYVDETAIIRCADRQGRDATDIDPPYDPTTEYNNPPPTSRRFISDRD